ncbi:MAG TPA: VOC family protein [Gemmatimonadaceae bacterium]|jgi:catechol 2,3-dioxygenase
MGVASNDIFGAGGGDEPATPGSFGQGPPGFRLPAETHVGAVRLEIADLARSVDYYDEVLGLRVLDRDAHQAVLAAHGSVRPLVVLAERPGAAPSPRRGVLGLYHFAILLPDRASLGRFARHLADTGVRAGSADHLVSEAFYLQDPDNLGIEVYADRPRDTWRRMGRQLMMATDPIDLAGLVDAAGSTPWNGMPLGTAMGHLHLHVGAIDAAAAFYADALGFDRTVWSYPGALFLSAGGYHHHLGTNTWAGVNARAAADGQARLAEWTLELPDAESIGAAAASLGAAGHAAEREDADVVARDPWGTRVRLRVPDPIAR